MRTASKATLLTAAGVGVALLSGAGTASATPPVPVPEPHGVIRMDIAPGEWWNCQGMSLQPPFYDVRPGYYQFQQGPNPIRLKFNPGDDVWVTCWGNGLPVYYYGPIVKARP